MIQVLVKAKAAEAERFDQVLREVVAQARGVAGCSRYDGIALPTQNARSSSTASSNLRRLLQATERGPW